MRHILIIVLCGLFFVACKKQALPKPASYLRLDFQNSSYKTFSGEAFQFQYADNAQIVQKNNNWLDVKYPALNATLVMTYSPVQNNLRALFKDAEKLTFKHMIKADDIQSVPFENYKDRVFGKIFEVTGDAATQIQFHATDSSHHFLTGALYFYVKPNYDSILPAVHHLRKDIVQLMETLKWKN